MPREFTQTGFPFLEDIQKALKLDRPIRSAVIKTDVEHFTTVEVQFFMEPEDEKAVAAVLSRYTLPERPVSES